MSSHGKHEQGKHQHQRLRTSGATRIVFSIKDRPKAAHNAPRKRIR